VSVQRVTFLLVCFVLSFSDSMHALSPDRTEKSTSSLFTTIAHLLPRYFVIVVLTLCYLVGRIAFGTTDIPDGLIRPAENPFYEFRGMKRLLNYAIVLSVHVGKSFCIDPIGFSHEYGYNCVREVGESVDGWTIRDVRLLFPLAIALGAVTLVLVCWRYGGLPVILDLFVAYVWLATLFPIAGILKVGTFIADRIVVASTVAFAVFGGKFLAWLVLSSPETDKSTTLRRLGLFWTRSRILLILCLFVALARRVMRRSEQWMTSYDLLKNSLVTCPTSAKSNLEISKCYSGLFPDKLDLDLAQ